MTVKLSWSGGSVTGGWDRPPGAPRAVMVLGHGAGGSYTAKLLADVGGGLVPDGVATLRFNFPYREAGRKTPNKAERAAPFFAEIANAARLPGIPLVIGGKSYGGRVASLAAAGGLDCDGLVFLSYPLHPPGKPEAVRDAHLADIKAPMLFLQSTRDPFARQDLLRVATGKLPNATLVPIEDGDHSFKVPGRGAADVTQQIIGEIRQFLAFLV